MNNYTEIIDKLCKKFGTTIEYLVPKTQVYGIWTSVISIIMFSILISIYVLFLIKTSKKYKNNLFRDSNEIEAIMIWVGFIISVILFFMVLLSINDLIKWITIPELALIEMVKW